MVAAKYTPQQKKDLVESINSLEKQEQEEMFSIFRRHNVKFSSNVNGIFINMKEVKVACFKEVEAFLVTLREQKERLVKLQEESIATLNGEQPASSFAPHTPTVHPNTGGGQPEDTALLKEDWTVQDKIVETPTVQAFVRNMTGMGVKKATTQQNKFFLLKKKYGKPFLSVESKKQEDMGIGGLEKEAYVVACA